MNFFPGFRWFCQIGWFDLGYSQNFHARVGFFICILSFLFMIFPSLLRSLSLRKHCFTKIFYCIIKIGKNENSVSMLIEKEWERIWLREEQHTVYFFMLANVGRERICERERTRENMKEKERKPRKLRVIREKKRNFQIFWRILRNERPFPAISSFFKYWSVFRDTTHIP